MKKLKNTNGITLVALIITIIVLLILATVSIRLIMNGGIIGKSEKGVQDYSIAEEKEQIGLGYKEYQMEKFQETNPTLKVEGATVTPNEEGWTIKFTKSQREYELKTDGTIIGDSEKQAALANNPWGGAATESEVHPEYFNYEVITTAKVDENGNQKLARLADTSGNIKIAETNTMGTIKITGINNAMVYSEVGKGPSESDEENDKELYIAKAKEKLSRIVIPSTVKIKDGKYDTTGTEYRVVSIQLNNIDPYKYTDTEDKVNTEVVLPNTITSLDEKAFYKTGITRVTIPNSVTSIGKYAFYGTQLTSVTIPNSVTSIGEAAFYSTQLTSVTIPGSVTNIGETPFDCEINVVECHNNYSIENGVLFNKNKTQLLRYPEKKQEENYEIPNSVTSISKHAFIDAKLKSITIPNSVTDIGFGAFSRCVSISTITIPNNVTSMGEDVFLYWKESQTINIRAASKPSGWHFSWDGYCNANIVWNYTGN